MSEDFEPGALGDGWWLTGRFTGHVEGKRSVVAQFEDLPLEEALAWARARADRVLLRYGDEPDVHYSAGSEHPPGIPVWPPGDLPPLVRRRTLEERWRDRTEADPPIAWRVEVALLPPGEVDRDAWRQVAAAAGADEWDSAPLDQYLADARDEGGWMSYGAVELRAFVTVSAATAEQACAAALARLTLPGDWRTECRPLPA